MMKFKFILSAAVLAGTAVTGFADGYQDGVEYYQVGQGENAKIVLDQTINDPEPVRLDGCLGVDSVSKFSIFLFNSISVIGFTAWHSSCDGTNTIPATALLRMLLLLRFLALLLEWYHLFHW